MTTAAAATLSGKRTSFGHLLLALPWIAIVIDAWAPIRDNSFLWHIRAGTLQSDAASVLTEDPFSFTMRGEPWLTQSWLAELVYDTGESWFGGLGFVAPMMLILTTITFVSLGFVAYLRSGSVTSTGIVLLLATISLISFLVPRPVVFSFALFGLVMVAWEIPKLRWTLPFLFWVWASVHGSFAIGLAYIGLALLAQKDWKWLPTATIAGLTTLLTAHGWGVAQMLLDFAGARETLSLLSEWQRPGLTDPVFVPFVVAVLIIGLGLVRRSIPLPHLLVIVPFALLGMTSLRAVPPAFLGLVPSMALALKSLRIWTAPRLSTGPAVIALAAIFVMPFLVRADGELADDRFPTEARAQLDNVNTFHDDRTGGYLIYSDGPDFLVFIDDRAELYGERMAEFVAVRDGETDWEPVFERDGIEQVLMSTEADLVAEIADSGWQIAYTDEHFTILKP